MAIGALSPYLKPAFIILVYPPFLFSYLLDRVFFTLFADFISCNCDTNLFVEIYSYLVYKSKEGGELVYEGTVVDMMYIKELTNINFTI